MQVKKKCFKVCAKTFASPVIKYTIALQGPNLRFLVGPATTHSCKILYSNPTNTRTARFDTISNSVFKEWTLRGGNELEQIDNSHILLNCLLDCLVSPSDRSNYYSAFGAESGLGTSKTTFSNRDGYMFIAAESQYLTKKMVSMDFFFPQTCRNHVVLKGKKSVQNVVLVKSYEK